MTKPRRPSGILTLAVLGGLAGHGCQAGGPLPRTRIDPSEMNVARVLHRSPIGLFTGDLFPASGAIVISLSGTVSGAWRIDLTAQAEGTFQPLCMVEGSPGQVYVCGRIRETSEAAIYRFSFTWSGSEPVLHPQRIYQGSAMGDITAIADLSDLNGCVAVFDFTFARLNYVDVASGTVRTLVEYDASHGEMLQVRGMIADFFQADSSQGHGAGLWFTLQPGQSIRFLDPEVFVLNVLDVDCDGVLDDFFTD